MVSVSDMRSVISSSRVFMIARILLGVVFVWASVPKIIDPRAFAVIVGNYQVLPQALVNPVALALPWLEALCGVTLIVGRLIRGSTLLVVCLMIIFIGLTGFNIFRGLDIDCGCFSVAAKEASTSQWGNLLRNLVIMLLGLFVLWRGQLHGRR